MEYLPFFIPGSLTQLCDSNIATRHAANVSDLRMAFAGVIAGDNLTYNYHRKPLLYKG